MHTLLKPTFTAVLAALLMSFATAATAQSDQPIPWHHMAYEVEGVPGIALSQARVMLSEEVPAQRVKVAVLDCGVDATHPALAGAIHTNLNEIEGNGIDDDDNGYIDDVVGWNFMVDSTGRSLNFARYEAHYFTHLYDSLQASGLPMPAWLKKLDMDLTREMAEEAQGYADDAWFYAELYFDFAIPFHDTFEEYPDNFEQIWFHRKAIGLNRAERKFLKFLMSEELTLWDFEYYVQEAWNYDKFWTNPDYNPRDPNEPETGYGNNDASGGYEDHGTHVAGIICGGATAEGGPIGIANGLVDIIPVRMVPDGDEIDKDVANAIRYAVDQGASIINMSFGKYVSSDPERVREALRYAAANDVLIVHAAGNEANDIDAFPFLPQSGPVPRCGFCLHQRRGEYRYLRRPAHRRILERRQASCRPVRPRRGYHQPRRRPRLHRPQRDEHGVSGCCRRGGASAGVLPRIHRGRDQGHPPRLRPRTRVPCAAPGHAAE